MRAERRICEGKRDAASLLWFQGGVVRRNWLLLLMLFGGLASALLFALMLQSPGWAAPLHSIGYRVDLAQTPVPSAYPAHLPEAYEQNTSGGSPNCRYGVAARGSQQLAWLPALGVGWYLDFEAHSPNGPEGIEFVQVIRIKQNKDGCTYLPGYTVSPPLTESGLENLVHAHPGALWLVGNEPDRGPNPGQCTGGQDDTYPEVYAEAYHEVYEFIKRRDPTAQVGVAGLVEVTPGRIQYLDKMWQAYLQEFGTPMPVDVWNMHLYILPEVEWDGRPNGIANVALGTDPALGIRNGCCDPNRCHDPRDNIYCYAEHDNLTIFADQVVRMRTWMKEHGQQNKPLILSEYSLLYPFEDYDDPINPTHCYLQDEFGKCFTAARVSNFMTRTFSYLETAVDPGLGYPPDNYRLVQQWLWFSLYYEGAGRASNLLSSTLTSLTLVGWTFSNTVNNIATFANLLPAEAVHPVAFTPAPSSTVSVTVQVKVFNNGNTYATGPITVTFYADRDLTQIIGSYVFTGTLGGCARRHFVAPVVWENLSEGSHRYWVKVEGDLYTTDNVTEGVVLVNPYQVFLPIIWRQR